VPNLDASALLGVLQRGLGREPRGSGRTGLPIAWASTRGSVREENQDRLVVGHAPNGLVVAALADGMGGMADGALAAAIATSTAMAHSLAHADIPLPQLLTSALNVANDEVFKALKGKGGAAMVLTGCSAGRWQVAHAGDARAFQVTAQGHLNQLTADDTIGAQLRQLGRDAPAGRQGSSDLLQFVGVGRDFEPHLSAVPDGGRGLLLTSDGVHGMPVAVMEWVVKGAGHLQLAAERLVAASELGGGRDNGSVIAISFQNGHWQPPRGGGAECWLGTEHLLVLGATPVRAVAVIQPQKAEERKSRGKKGRKPPKERSQRAKQPKNPMPERQLIVEFSEPISSSDAGSDTASEEKGGHPRGMRDS
jgi:PPM family protein phosphatase